MFRKNRKYEKEHGCVDEALDVRLGHAFYSDDCVLCFLEKVIEVKKSFFD